MVEREDRASPSRRNPQWRQIIPSSECANWKRQWPVVPTCSHGGLDYGTITVPPGNPPRPGSAPDSRLTDFEDSP